MRLLRHAAALAVVTAATLSAESASAWSRAGHMVSAAIAYDDLAAHDPAVLDKIAKLIQAHPDKGAFNVATGSAEGRARALAQFLECARWPDDARGTLYDHPTWHYTSNPVVRPDAPHPPGADDASGQAVEALDLNLRVAANPHAPQADRAVALCWVMHVAADMHQPLHAATLYSASFPEGDSGGNNQWIINPDTKQPAQLHGYWDDLVHRDEDAASTTARARQLEKRYPRAALSELQDHPARAVAGWISAETFPATTQAFPAGWEGGSSAETAKPLPKGYAKQAKAIAERRMAVAGYRVADLLRIVAAEHEGRP